MIRRIGFCCKYVTLGKKGIETVEGLNTSTTTVAWLNRNDKSIADKKLWELIVYNLQSTYNLVNKVSEMDPHMRMMRVGSDILPVYTEPTYSSFYKDPSVRNYCATEFAKIGELARKNNVRLSFHPGQFCVLASHRPDVVDKSIEEFEYHTDMARWMGYGSSWHDHGFKINVHIAGKLGADGIKAVLPRLSTEARNLITIENDENSHGLEDILELEKNVALVLDIHHHWVRTNEYIDVQDDRVQRVINSWRGVRPVLHYSVSREDTLVGHDPNVFPNRNLLKEQKLGTNKIRAHSDFYWNNAVNDWAMQFVDSFDICCESKAKNLASERLYKQYQSLFTKN